VSGHVGPDGWTPGAPPEIPQGPVTNGAGDRALGMSLQELAVFVQDCLRRDLDPASTRISAVVGFRASQVQKITATPKREG